MEICVNCGKSLWLVAMSTREEFFVRIHKALGRRPDELPPARCPDQLFTPLDGVMSPIPSDQIIDKFEAELQKVDGNTHRAGSLKELDEILRSILQQHQVQSVVCTRNPMLKALGLSDKFSAWGLTSTVWSGIGNGRNSFKEKAFSAEVGVTGVEFMLAESGSLVLTSQTEGAQLASLAPPTHIALYRRSQARASLEEVLERLPVPADPNQAVPGRAVVFITGPSRTADIEQVLIRGVHGPKEVHAILVEDACFA